MVNCSIAILGIGTLLAVAILSFPQLGTEDVANALKWLFMAVLPNFCLGESFSDFYSNYVYLGICKPWLRLCPLMCLTNLTLPPKACCEGVILRLLTQLAEHKHFLQFLNILIG